jgi:hypothetical protein
MTEGHTERLETALAGRYKIHRKLGEGGMASVYLAEDLKHERNVALKILKPELAAVIGAERFLAEIKTTANLQHPHILPLFDSGEADSFLYYVMPYIEGESLRERLDREGQLGVEEAARIAREVADALDYAHRNDVIHRDIKPANILLHDGRPVVADFGIALAISAAGGGRMTETGLSLGTPHYMSPEQASADRDLSARSDVYSLGCVLYEMLAGQPPHTGPSAQSVLVRILTEDPRPITELRRSAPPNVAAAVTKAIEKLPADRFDTAQQFIDALEDTSFAHTSVPRARPATAAQALPTEDAPAARARKVKLGAAIGVAAVATVLAAIGWLRPSGPAPVRRMVMVLDSTRSDFGPSSVISPDGSQVVYTGAAGRLWLRPLQSLESRPIPQTQGARTPFFSPDGQRVGFHRGNGPGAGELATVSLSGAPPVQVVEGNIYPGGAWSDDGFIYFVDEPGTLFRVGEEGGPAAVVSDSTSGYFYSWPEALPGGGFVIVTGFPAGEGGESGIVAVNTGSGEASPLMADLTGPQRPVMARYAGGYLFWRTENRTLMAGEFDVRALEMTGSTIALTSGIGDAGGLSGEFDVADDGTLIYGLAQISTVGLGESMTWVSLGGDPVQVDERLLSDVGDIDYLSLSPDGGYIAAEVQTGVDGAGNEVHQIWIYDRDQSTFVRLTLDGELNRQPRWLDGRTVAFLSTSASGTVSIKAQSIDGGAAEVLFNSDRAISDFAVTPAGGPMAVTLADDEGGSLEVVMVDPSGTAEANPIVSTRFEERSVELSPDGQWMAYVSNESGRDEVYVRAFPGGDRRAAISVAGGIAPKWSPTGQALFYVGAESNLMVAELSVDDRVSVDARSALFSASPFETVVGGGGVVGSYDVVDGGERLLMTSEASGTGTDRRVIVLNVFEELKARSGR